MNKAVPFLFFFFCLFIGISNINAQPELHKKGCHHFRNLIPLEPLTESDKEQLQLSKNRSDTIDILNYNITLEIIDFSGKTINGFCEVQFAPLQDQVNHITLDLLEFNIDSITQNGQLVTFDFDGLALTTNLDAVYNIGDTTSITVYYNGTPVVDPTEFGGLDFRGGYAYNLGIGLGSNPYNYGRGWFPCFDNFVERSTYDFNIITANVRKAYCSGTLINEVVISGDTIMRSFRMNNPLTTYLAGVAVANYAEINGEHSGLAGNIPTQLLCKPADVSAMQTSFANLGGAIDVLEYWFGPYCWNRVGYVHTARGAMEHAENIAYPDFVGVTGNNEDQRDLMGHELAHQWWGNVTTLSSPADMWIKEGNAEYGAHLLTEWLFGKEAFLDKVRDNQINVMEVAHLNDGGYLALSPMPFEYTYGTHTYYKGAAEMHNLRGYLGDSLFRHGMTTVLAENKFSSMDADQFRVALTEATGIDMTPFFNAHIYNPGWTGFEIDSIKSTPAGSGFDVNLFFHQKLYRSPVLHEAVPLMVTFMDEQGNQVSRKVIASGEFSEATTNIPFEPTIQIVNYEGTLTLAQFVSKRTIELANNYGFADVGFSINLTESLDDPVDMFVQHLWISPDHPLDNPEGVRLSSTHYWQIDGNYNPDDFNATALIEYRRSGNMAWDADLTSITEDSLILVYRRDASQPWAEFPFYNKQVISPNDGNGFIRILSPWQGQYAFANGDLPLVDVLDQYKNLAIKSFPNPASEKLIIIAELEQEEKITLDIFTLSGKKLREIPLQKAKSVYQEIELDNFKNGFYILQMINQKGHTIKSEKFEILNP